MSMDVLDALAAAELLNVHVETLRRLARRGDLPSFKVGKDWRFERGALERWASGQQAVSQPGPPPPSPRQPSERPLVLVVDDEERVRASLLGMLERLGCRGVAASDGVAALELLGRETPALVLLDLMMPQMDGPEILRRMRETHQELPVVIVTGQPDSALMTQAMEHGPLLLLAKPVSAAQLTRTVGVVLGKTFEGRVA